MANSALTLRMLSRETFRLFWRSRRSRDSAQADEAFAVDPAIIGGQLRIRLPQDYRVEVVSERERAEKRSMELLYDWLNDAERKELALEQYFTITGEFSGKRYQVHKVHSFGLKELDGEGNVVACFCVVPSGTHALGDTMLAQKVWMETDERSTLERANRMPQLGTSVLARPAAEQMLGNMQLNPLYGGAQAQGLGQLQATPEQLAQMAQMQAQAQYRALGLGYTPLGGS